MGVWNTGTPVGTDAKSTLDDRIRELKVAVEEALQGGADEGDEAIFPGAAPTTAPIFRYRGLKGNTAARPASGQYGLYFDSQRLVFQRDNGSSWEDVGTVIPSGTKMLFPQASVPTGWTKETTHQGPIFRSHYGLQGGQTFGSHDVADAITLAHSHTVDAHTHDLGSHTHSTPNHQHEFEYSTQAGAGVSTGVGSSVASANSDGSVLGLRAAGASTVRLITNRTQSTGAATTGTPSSNTSGSTSPGTNSALTNVSISYLNVLIGAKD